MEAASRSNLAAVLPLSTSLPQLGDSNEKGEQKPARFLVAKKSANSPNEACGQGMEERVCGHGGVSTHFTLAPSGRTRKRNRFTTRKLGGGP